MGIYPSEEDIAAVQIGKASAPIGTPRKVAEVPLPRGLDAFGEDVPDKIDGTLAGPSPSRPASAGAASAVAAGASLPQGMSMPSAAMASRSPSAPGEPASGAASDVPAMAPGGGRHKHRVKPAAARASEEAL
jgi:penicillin-binding protein 2